MAISFGCKLEGGTNSDDIGPFLDLPDFYNYKKVLIRFLYQCDI